MTYSEAIEFLYSLRWFGAKLGLTNTFKLASLAGNPQEKLNFIHVAGTNGKGSTSAMLESIYRTAGLRVGLFTSPHLVSFSERIQVNREPASEQDIVSLVAESQPWLKQFPADEHPTFFEVVTVMALRYFLKQRCDLVIWETGLGGRLDATNIVTPLASIITNIQYDHQKWLGETLASIAAEKAGIIKPQVPVITAAQGPEALSVINAVAMEKQAPLTCVEPESGECPPLNQIRLSLAGKHQAMNAAVAIAAVRVLNQKLPVSDRQICQGLTQVSWPGRLQLITTASGQRVLLDGAHNSGGAESLAAALREYFPGAKLTLLLGILQDKDWAEMCRLLAPLAARIVLVPVHSERTANPHELAEACRRVNQEVIVEECRSLADGLARTTSDPFITIAGSLYLVGEAMELLAVSPAPARSERLLNEWTLINQQEPQKVPAPLS